MAAGTQPRPSRAALVGGCVFGEGMTGMRATRYRSQPDTAIAELAARQLAKAFHSAPNVAFTPGLCHSARRPLSAPPLRLKLAFSGSSI